jgi:hypothetical protein
MWDIKVLSFDVTEGTANSLAAKLSTGARLRTIPMDSRARIEILPMAWKESSYADCLTKWSVVVHHILKTSTSVTPPRAPSLNKRLLEVEPRALLFLTKCTNPILKPCL